MHKHPRRMYDCGQVLLQTAVRAVITRMNAVLLVIG